MARLKPPFWPENPPQKVYVHFCVLSQEMRHVNFFLGPQSRVFWVGAKNYVERVYVLFLSPKLFGHAQDIPAKIPGYPRPKVWFPCVSKDIPNFLAPTPSRGRPPPHPKISGPKSLCLGSFFFPDMTMTSPPRNLRHIWLWSSGICLLRRRTMTMTKIPSTKTCHTYGHGLLKDLSHAKPFLYPSFEGKDGSIPFLLRCPGSF